MQNVSVRCLNEKADLTNPENPDYEDVRMEVLNLDMWISLTSKEWQQGALRISTCRSSPAKPWASSEEPEVPRSSLVNLISRLYDVTAGEVLVGGKDVREYDLETLRNQVAVVLQKNVLFSGTILENLRWGDKNATEEECMRGMPTGLCR